LAINESEKYLEFTIGYRLNFEGQIKLLTSKIPIRVLGIICKLRHIIQVIALRISYYFMIHLICYTESLLGGNAYKSI